MANFVRSANPVWFMVDLVGQALNDQYYAFFLTNTLPYLPQTVYQDPAGNVAWANPLQFGPDGTLPNNLYFEDDLVYRIEIRQGNSQTSPLIRQIDDFVPNNGVNDTAGNFLGLDNQVTNPQFKDVSFYGTLSLTSAGTYNVAPGWNLVLSGAGTAAVSQQVYPSNSTDPTPPYALKLILTGWTTAQLVQQFNGFGALWQNGAVTMSVTAKSDVGILPITLSYVPEPPGVPQDIVTKNINTANYTVIADAKTINSSLNTNLNSDSYVQMVITLPLGTVYIGNVQMIGQSQPLPSNYDVPEFQQTTSERETNELFYYYKPILSGKQTPSYLVGWDFPLNPCQIVSRSSFADPAHGANTSYYSWDQTIIFRSTQNSITVGEGSKKELVLTATQATQPAIIQYLGAEEARKILNDRISVNFSGKTSKVGGVSCTISLWYTTSGSLPVIDSPSFQSIVGTLDANGFPIGVNGGFVQVTRKNANAKFTLEQANGTENFNDYGFSGWDMEGIPAIANANFFAIVIGFGSINASESISVNSVSLTSGDTPCRPAPQTKDEVLRQCQYYYEKSYDVDVAVGSAVTKGRKIHSVSTVKPSIESLFCLYSFNLDFKQQKRKIPILNFYSPTGAGGTIQGGILRNGSFPSPVSGTNPADYQVLIPGAPPTQVWDVNSSISTSGVSPQCTQTSTVRASVVSSSTYGDENVLIYHYVADARFGIV